MQDLISRQAAINALYDKGSSMTAWGELLAMKWSDIQKCIEQLPSADRPRGHWIDMADFEQCSVCRGTHLKEVDTYYGKAIWIKTDFCPNCGADMKERSE